MLNKKEYKKMLKLFFIFSALVLVALANKTSNSKSQTKDVSMKLTPEIIDQIVKDCLVEHNKYRHTHQVKNLTLNDELSLIADKAVEMFGKDKIPTDDIEIEYNNGFVGLNFATFRNRRHLNGMIFLILKSIFIFFFLFIIKF